MIITAVDPNSDAAEQGLQRGDLIISVNNQPVTTPAQVIAAVDAARKAGRSSVLLLVKRGNCARGLRRGRHQRQVSTPPSAALALQLLLAQRERPEVMP